MKGITTKFIYLKPIAMLIGNNHFDFESKKQYKFPKYSVLENSIELYKKVIVLEIAVYFFHKQ